jgi:Mg2+/citrate symporter
MIARAGYIGILISTISEAIDTHICLLLGLLFIYYISYENCENQTSDIEDKSKDYDSLDIERIVIDCDT